MKADQRIACRLAVEHGGFRVADSLQQRQMALSNWENEGGALQQAPSTEPAPVVLPLTNAELVQLQVRMIALENLVIALLSEGADRQLALARDMAACILPRPGFTHHRLTVHAAAQMIHLVGRATRLG